MSNPRLSYLKRNLDEAAILAVAAKVAFEEDPSFSESELATLAAMQRAHPQAGDTPEELARWLSQMDEDQVLGVVSNTKGVLHEMEFVRIENEDGDSVHAALYEATNHADYDVQFVDAETGAVWEAQLKATNDPGYAKEWVADHPEGEIIVTDEVAAELDLPSSGQTNEALTARTDEFVDRLIELDDHDSVWDYVPAMAVVSIGMVVWELYGRYRAGEITFSRFKWMVAKATGLRASKITLLSLAMTVPGLNVVTGAALVAQLLHSAAKGAQRGSRALRANPIQS